MTINKGLAFAIVGTMFFANCSQPKTDQKDKTTIDTQIVLNIGKVNISAYEFKKNQRVQAPANTYNPVLIKNASSGNWKNDFIDKVYILADAYDKGYNNNAHIDSIVENAARFMVAQPNGLLEQATSAEYQVNEDEVKTAIAKSKKVIYIEYLKFKDKSSALKSLQGANPHTTAEFKKLIDNADLLEVTYKKEILTWPFNGYWGKEDEIYAMKKGDVLPLLDLYDGYYLIHAERTSELHGPAITTDVMKVKLEQAQKKKTTDLFNHKVFDKAQPVLNSKAITAFSNKLSNYRYGPNHTFLQKDFRDILSEVMLTYISPSGRATIVTVNNFMDYYNMLFLKGNITNVKDVYATLNNIYFSDYAYDEGVKKGVTKQPKFILDRNNYKNNVIYTIYAEKELSSKDMITQNEIISRYSIMKPTQAQKVVASVYYFNNRNEAMRKKFNILSDTMTFKGLIKADKNLMLTYKSKMLPDTLKRVIFDLNIKSNPARMIELNNQYIVLIKEKEIGTRTRSLAEVKDLVIAEVRNSRLLKNKEKKLAELKIKYKPKIDLTDRFNLAIAMN